MESAKVTSWARQTKHMKGRNEMERIEFNTGRKYAANGQNIVAICDGKKVWFKDEARLIQGSFEMDEFDTFDRKTVMFRYDNNQYRMDMFPKVSA